MKNYLFQSAKHSLKSSLRYGLLILVFIAFEGKAQDHKAELTFVYWMPYDNNLSHWADTIYQQIQSGLTSKKFVVTIQKDKADTTGMTRTLISHKGIVNEKIKDEKSYAETSYKGYLQWVKDKVKSEKYVLIFLDHGGKLDEVGLDEYPKKDFLRIDGIARAIHKFNESVDKKTELVYLQVCTKGSIEPLYELKGVSSYTMFSQTILGAPNFYYKGFFNEISESNTELNGADLANLIAKHERSDMYSSLICIDNSKFPSFSREFTKFIHLTNKASAYEMEKNKPLFYYGQTYFDLKHFSSAFTGIESNGLNQSINDLIVMKKLSGDHQMVEYSGISLLGIQKNYNQDLEQYAHLRFFKDFDMKSLFFNTLKLYKKRME